jgi:K+-transporting ATPase ATPase C chain
MRRDIVTSAIGILLFTILLGIVYPLVITGISQGLFPGNANGQQVRVGGRLVGSKIIGQAFDVPVMKDGRPELKEGKPVLEADPRYFQSRPSATQPEPYDASASASSNAGPNSRSTEEADAERIREYLALNRPYDPGLTTGKVPVDAVNTSASGLDPDISEANARIQAHRVAALRHMSLHAVDALIAEYTSSRGLGFSGEPGVNVLELNLALDRTSATLAGAGPLVATGVRR